MGLVGAGLALVLPLLTISVVVEPSWLPRYALLAVEAAVGVPLLFALLRTTARRAAMAALVFCVICTASTVLSDNPSMSFWGQELFGSGLLFVLAMAGAWAIGVSSGRAGASAIERALLLGAAIN